MTNVKVTVRVRLREEVQSLDPCSHGQAGDLPEGRVEDLRVLFIDQVLRHTRPEDRQ